MHLGGAFREGQDRGVGTLREVVHIILILECTSYLYMTLYDIYMSAYHTYETSIGVYYTYTDIS